MICSFLNRYLSVPEMYNEAIKKDTPQLAFIKTHKSDIQKEMGAIKAVIETIPNLDFIIDGMAGSGFSGRIFQYCFPKCSLLLNDLSPACYETLKINFPEQEIQNKYAHQIKISQSSPDLFFIDFNNFTLNRKREWVELFDFVHKVSPTWFMFTDSFSYSFKFKKTNKKAYYRQLNEFLYSTYGWGIQKICIFGNAAIILCEKRKGTLLFIEKAPSILYTIQKQKGLFECF